MPSPGASAMIIGHSFGGVIARNVARQHAELVRQVITLGAPLRTDAAPLSPSIPLAAIYSRTDRVVRYPRAGSRRRAESRDHRIALRDGGQCAGLPPPGDVAATTAAVLTEPSARDSLIALETRIVGREAPRKRQACFRRMD